METFYPDFSPRFVGLLPGLAGKKIAVIGHARPDGDCIGSQVALARMLVAQGLDAVCVNPDPVPRRLQFLVPGMTFLDGARGGERLRQAFPRPFAVIDHHLSNAGFGTHNFIDTGSAATAEILAGIFLDNGYAMDAQTAQALYAGILTDTGQFRFHSTSRRSFLLAAELLTRGAHPSEAGYELYERESLGKLQLLQHFLSSLRLECGGRLCIGTLRAGIFDETDTSAEDTEGLVDFARGIDGVDVGVLIEERHDGTVKASLRAKEAAFRVDLVAAQFNGGGHACAAGLNLKENTTGFRERLVTAIAERFAVVGAESKTAES
jgi:phosphoesterase RecJ-like protein